MKKLKWIGIILVFCVICIAGCFKILSKELPTGVAGSEADALAQSMLMSLNKPAWDTLRYAKWSFFGDSHHYHWDKLDNKAIIEWKKNKVVMDLDQVDGSAFKDGVAITDPKKKKELIDKAWNYWCNDSFWFYAPFKVMDKGVVRSIVEVEGKKGLKVSYQSGGVTPGDSYVWWLDENYIPTDWQMWTQILPVQGVKNSWEKWIKLPGGAMISTAHGGLGITAELNNVKGSMNIEGIDLQEGAFQIN